MRFLFLFFFIFCSFLNAERKFVFIVPSYNNSSIYKRNLDSLLNQNYKNYRIIYIDDCSTDGTGELVEEYVRELNKSNLITVIKNKKRVGALANIYKAVHMCKDDEIVIQIDGDDWCSSDNVLKIIDFVYSDPDIWLTYGNYIYYPSLKEGFFSGYPKEIIENNEYMRAPAMFYPRSFYAWLFKMIKLEDLLYQGYFFPMTWDFAIMFKMLEMAGGRHFRYIFEPLAVYNVINPINDARVNKELKQKIERIVRNRTKYENLRKSLEGYFDSLRQKEADLIIFASDRNSLIGILDRIKDIGGIDRRFIFFNEDIDYDHIEIIKSDFKNNLIKIIKNSLNEHFILSEDKVLINNDFNIGDCIEAKERTHAFLFHLGFSKNFKDISSWQLTPPYIELNSDIIARQFKYSKGDFLNLDKLCFTLYSKKDLLKIITSLEFNNLTDLKKQLKLVKLDLNQVGLCFYI